MVHSKCQEGIKTQKALAKPSWASTLATFLLKTAPLHFLGFAQLLHTRTLSHRIQISLLLFPGQKTVKNILITHILAYAKPIFFPNDEEGFVLFFKHTLETDFEEHNFETKYCNDLIQKHLQFFSRFSLWLKLFVDFWTNSFIQPESTLLEI